MALQSIKYGLPLPVWPNLVASLPSLAANVIDGAAKKAGIVCKATAAKNIRKVHFRTGTVTTGDTLDIRIETVDATTGLPTGTLWATNTNVAHVLGNGDDDKWNSTAALTADATLAVGDVYAIVINNGGGGGSWWISRYEDQSLGGGFPYGAFYNASWAKQATQSLIVAEYSDGTFEPVLGVLEFGTFNATAFNSGSGVNQRGNRMSLPFPARASGAWMWGIPGGDYAIKLYDSDGTTVLATTGTIDKDIVQVAGVGLQFHPFTTKATLAANTTYRIAVVPTTVTDVTLYEVDVASAAMMDMFPGGSNIHRTINTAGVWSQTTTTRSFVGVFLDAFDDAVSAGGSGGSFVFAG